MKNILNLFDFSQKINYKTEILSGLTVALVLVPEAVAFAIIAGLSPLTGLYAGFVMCFITAVFGGRPGMISGATGAVAVVIVALVKTHGLEYIYATVILAGVLQATAGLFKLGKLIRLVPQPAMLGFVNGLAVVIFMSQIVQFKTVGLTGTLEWLQGEDLFVFLGLVVVSILIIWGLPKITKVIPSSLAAILVVFGLVFFLGIDTKTVGDAANGSIQGAFPPFHIPEIAWDLDTLFIVFPYALVVAGVGLIESLLTLNILDEITQTRGNSNREAIAQGTANILSGFFSGMGGCATVGQSLINVANGARARLSGIFASLMLLIFIMFGSSLIDNMPMAALTGIMIMIAVTTFEWASLRMFKRMPKSDMIVMILVTLITVFMHNLALAVLIGVVVSALVFAWENAKMIRARKYIDTNGAKHYEMFGPLFFGSVTAFNEKFDIANDPNEVVIDFKESRVVDMSGIEALNKLTDQYLSRGKKLHLKHLSPDCVLLLKNAEQIIDVNIMEDPTYRVAVDKD